MCGCRRGNTKLEHWKVQILWGHICKCSLLNPWWRARKSRPACVCMSVYACVCLCMRVRVMWKTNEHCNVGYWPSPALLFLRANPAASPPLPPPPQPPQKLYNGELLSLCYLTPTTHYALPAWWETEEQRREEEWEHGRPREEKSRMVAAKIRNQWERKRRKSVCCFLFCSILIFCVIITLRPDIFLLSNLSTTLHYVLNISCTYDLRQHAGFKLQWRS